MKKWILLLLAMACIVSGAMAEEAALQPARYAPGETARLVLNLTAPGISGLQMQLAWDPAALELAEEPEMAGFFCDDTMMTMMYLKEDEGTLTIVWMQDQDIALTDVSVLELSLRVREDACGGETAVSIPALQLNNAAGETLHTQAEGVVLWIDAPLPMAPLIPAETPQSTDVPVPTPQPYDAHVWLTTADTQALPEASATPGQYIPSRPGDSTGKVVIEPTSTPVPTPPTVVIGNTPAPAVTEGKLCLRVTEQGAGFLVELLADDMTIGGLQATISYDPTAATCTSAAFTREARASAMIQMAHCDDAGHIRLVYSSTEGYAASGEAIFAAEFAAASAEQIVLTLSDVKCTNMEENLSIWQMENQQTVYTIQPMDDMTIVENESKGADAP